MARTRAGYLLRAMLIGGFALLAAGGALHLAGQPGLGDLAWSTTGMAGAIWSAYLVLNALRGGRVGVDAIAVVALVGALLVGELFAAALITVMLASGRALEARAAGRARAELTALVARAPVEARRYADGTLEVVPLDSVGRGDVLLVRSGEVVPVDGRVERAAAVLDESALTGEAAPVTRWVGDGVRSGVVNAGGPFDLLATTSAADSTYAAIVRLVEQASAASAPFVRLADRYAAWFLPLSLGLAGIAWLVSGDPVRAVAVLVVATPCPLILAAPVALVSGMSRAAGHGVIVKDGGALEQLAAARVLLLDKTGTLTAGRPSVAGIVTAGDLTPDELLELAASAEQVSPHILAAPIVQLARERDLALRLPTDVTEVPGKGVRGVVAGRSVAVGQAGWVTGMPSPVWLRTVQRRVESDGDMLVVVAVDHAPAGAIVLRDVMRPDAARTVRDLRQSGIRRVVLVTGDRHEAAELVGAIAGADLVMAERLPEEKLAAVQAERHRGPVLMVGDGINDAAALAAADVGVALGARGTTVASEAADVVLMVDRLDRLAAAMRVAQRSRRIALQSVTVGMGLSLAAMGLAAWGLLVPALGAVLQEAIDVAVIANALRAAAERPGRIRLSVEDARLLRRFSTEHPALRPILDELRAAADVLVTSPQADTLERLSKLHRRLVDELEPHELAEGAELYPVLDRVLGNSEATSTMSRAHVEISHLIRQLGRLLDEIGSGFPDESAITRLRQVLYGLHAICTLHFAQEEESYFSLVEDHPDGERAVVS
jgi:heavy metal translocating P-type ATPase